MNQGNFLWPRKVMPFPSHSDILSVYSSEETFTQHSQRQLLNLPWQCHSKSRQHIQHFLGTYVHCSLRQYSALFSYNPCSESCFWSNNSQAQRFPTLILLIIRPHSGRSPALQQLGTNGKPVPGELTALLLPIGLRYKQQVGSTESLLSYMCLSLRFCP